MIHRGGLVSAALDISGLTYADYVALERQEDVRYEFLDGHVWAMAGGTLRHSRIKMNVGLALGNALGNSHCQPYDSDLKVRVPETGLATYPDITVICGQPETHPEDKNAATNPTLIVEVLSETTEKWDRGDKFAHYRTLPSLQHYLLVRQEKVGLEHFRRQADGSWRLTDHVDGTIDLDAVGVHLDVASVYRNLPDPEPPVSAKSATN